jgi:hypothetical protein
MPAKQHGVFSRPRSTIMVIRMPLPPTRLWWRKSLKLQLDIKADKGSEPTPGKVQRADLPFPCVFQVCSPLSHETRLVTTHRRMDHVVPLFPPYTST